MLNSVGNGRPHRVNIVFVNDLQKNWSSFCRYNDALVL